MMSSTPRGTAASSAPPAVAAEPRDRTSQRSVVRGGALLTAGQVVALGCSLTRNIILARALSKADFGLAAAFALTISLLELSSRMSFGPQLVQSPNGERDDFLASAHAAQAGLGGMSAVLIAVLSYPLAVAFGAPEAAWGFACLALLPALRAFENLDVVAQRRHLRFLPSVLCEALPNVGATLATWPAVVLWPDYRAVLVVLAAKGLLTAVLTHVLADRPFRLRLHRVYVAEMWTFGWPLLLNGLVMFLAQQGDQLLVGAFLSLEQLAVYAVAFSLISIPWFLGVNVASSLMLPLMARARDDAAVFAAHYRRGLEYIALACALMLGPLIAVGGFLIEFFYGEKYAGAGVLTAVLGLTCGARFLRVAPAIAAMATADTVNQLYSNLWRGISFPLMGLAVVFGGNVVTFALCALAAELVALTFSCFRFSTRTAVPLRSHGGAVALLTVCFGLASTVALIDVSSGVWSACAVVAVNTLVALGVAAITTPSALRELRDHFTCRLPGARGLEAA